MKQIIESFLQFLEYRDVYTRGHTERGVYYALEIGKEMALTEEELELLRIGGIVHDIGKIAIPDVILLKPGRLTPEEFEIMKLHVKLGAEMLKHAGLPEKSMQVLLYHQEKYDGTGYPFGKRAEDIPFLARIYTVADSFEAMTARRIYKRAKSWEEAFRELEELAGIHFDPSIVPYAIRALKKLTSVPAFLSKVNSEIEKVRWSFQYMDPTSAIKGDLFLPSLKAFMEQRESFCLTIFDIRNLSQINLERGWEAGNEVLRNLVWAINLECCAMHDIREVILKLMKEEVIDIMSPVIFRIGGDEFAVIAPYIPPPEKVKGVERSMHSLGVEISYLQMSYPESFSSYQEVLERIFAFTKKRLLENV